MEKFINFAKRQYLFDLLVFYDLDIIILYYDQ